MRRPQPYSKELEQAIIACVLLDTNAIDYVRAELPAEGFYKPEHQRIMDLVYQRHVRGEAVDVVSIIGGMSDEQLDNAGGVEYISSMVDIIPNSGNIQTYVADAVKLWKYRRMIQTTGAVWEKCYEQDGEPDVLAAELAREVVSISRSQGGIKTLLDMSEVLEERYNKFISGKLVGLSMGIRSADMYTSGLQPGLTVIAGRPHMGKSSFGMCMAGSMALRGARGLICQFDGSLEGYLEKFICQVGGFDRYKLTFGKVDAQSYTNALKSINDMGLKFMGERMNAYALRAKIQSMRDEIDFVLIDQLSTVPHIKDKEDEVSAINRTVTEIKAMAVDLHLPVILLCQINRGVENRSDRRPFLSDLKGSGRIEEEADVVMLLYRDEYYNEDTKDAGVLEVDLAKNKFTEITKVLKLTDGQGWRILPPTVEETAGVAHGC